MSFYNGEPFIQKSIVTAKVDNDCPACHKLWFEGDRIRSCKREPYGENDWFHMHIECAENHPMRQSSSRPVPEPPIPVTEMVRQPVREEFKWLYGTQRDAIRFVMDYGTAVVEFDSTRRKGQQFRYRVL